MFGALCYAELGSSFPEAGGEYAYLRRGFGKRWGFLFGWMHSVVARPASAAAIAAGLLRFCSFLVPALAVPLWTIHLHAPFGVPSAYDLRLLVAARGRGRPNFNHRHKLPGRSFRRTSADCTYSSESRRRGRDYRWRVSARSRRPHHLEPLWPRSPGWGTVTGFFAALGAAVWAYDGWNDLNLVGSEVENPERNFPRVLVGATSFVIVIFLLFTGVCFYTLPFQSIASSQHVASDVFASFAGHHAALWITLIMAISALGTLNSSILSGARVDYAMARDGIFFATVAKVHPKFRTPGNALIFQCCLASLLALSGTFEDPHVPSDVRQLDFLWPGCAGDDADASHRANPAAALSNLGISSGSVRRFSWPALGRSRWGCGSARPVRSSIRDGASARRITVLSRMGGGI